MNSLQQQSKQYQQNVLINSFHLKALKKLGFAVRVPSLQIHFSRELTSFELDGHF